MTKKALSTGVLESPAGIIKACVEIFDKKKPDNLLKTVLNQGFRVLQ
jgi:hypothetical protein